MSETLTEKERHWAHEAGIDCGAATIERVDGEAGIWVRCARCGGEGRIWCFGHVDGGVCFACRGAKRFFRTLKARAAKARAAIRKSEKAARERYEAPRRAAREARELLAATPGLAVALRAAATDGFVRDLARQLARKGRLSEKQIAAAFRAAEREAAKPAAIEIEAGRRELTGTIISLKSVETDFGIVERMLVEIEPGARVFGTVPSVLLAHTNEELIGRRVRFAATVTPKEPGFAFFKRPAKATLIDEIVPVDEKGLPIELDCGHLDCARRYAAEIKRVGEHTAEALCIEAERAETERYYEADAAATRREG